MGQRGEINSDLSGRDLETIEIVVGHDGSPVTLEAGSWYVCFVPGLKKQWWHPFVNKRHKHVFAMRPAGPGEWTLFEPWWNRLLTATITSEQARKFLLWGARGDVLHVHEAIPGRGSQVRGWMTCAALASYLLGRKYRVWTPDGSSCANRTSAGGCLGARQTRRRQAGRGIAGHRGLR